MHAYAVTPPIMYDARQRRNRYINRNSLLEDPMTMYKEQKMLNIWTETEKMIFRERYLQQPKNFTYIAQYLERKVNK